MQDLNPWAEHLRLAIEVAATLAFALSGLFAAARKRLDAVGVFTVTFLAAFGGGTLRDLLLDQRPFFWTAHVHWLWALMALTVGAMLFVRHRHFEPTERAMQWPDALGLGLFTASGTQIALQAGSPALVAVLMGVITATFGGVLRDIVCNEIPALLRDHRPYAVCAFVGAWVVVALPWLGAEPWQAMLAGGVVSTLLRIVALWTGYTLPRWSAGA